MSTRVTVGGRIQVRFKVRDKANARAMSSDKTVVMSRVQVRFRVNARSSARVSFR